MSKISIIVPVYFNEHNLELLFQELKLKVLNNKFFDFEVVFVDDGSGDKSYEQLLKLRVNDQRVKIIKLSRNFGSHTAILAGLSKCTGDCATMISADLQDSPELILKMAEKWQEGSKVVLAVREDREEGFIQKSISNSYYSLMRKYALKNMPLGGFDCFLIDRQVIGVLASMSEKNSTLMGQILWCGFPTQIIPYVRKRRKIGKSRWTLSKKIKLFIDSFLAFSYAPIKLISAMGFFFAILGLIYAIFIIINKFLNAAPVQGWSSLMVVILIASGVQLLTLGVIGEYLWRNFDESRNRPNYIIEGEAGFDDKR